MILVTGATGLIGRALVRRLSAGDAPVRCLVRDPRRLGADRVRVQIALGDLANPRSFRNALRGVDTVVHLAVAIRDQPRASIEEVSGLGTWRLLRAAERAGAERFVYFSALGAGPHARTRLLRSKALAEQAVASARIEHAVVAPSLVYAPGDAWLTLIERMSLLPALAVPGRGRAHFQPIWADDVADCVVAALARDRPLRPRYELAGPQALTHDEILRLALRSLGRRRRLLHVPAPVVRRSLLALESLLGPTAFATWDEAELLEVEMTSPAGTADAERLGITPRRMAAVLGVG